MVSTRSQSVLSTGAEPGDVHGEVNSAAPTPRRSGRLRGGPGSGAAAEQAAPPTARAAARSRGALKAIEEEPEQQQQHNAGEQQQEGANEQLSPRARRRSAADAAAASDAEASEGGSQSEEEEGGQQQQPLRATAAVVDLLAQEMFAALDGAFGMRAQQGAAASDSSDSEADDERQQQQQQQQRRQAEGDSDEASDSEGEDEYRVPEHLRWRPELTLPGTGASPQQQQQQQRGRGGAQSTAAAGVPTVQAVRRGADALHVPPPDERVRVRAARAAAPDTAGKGWFDLPATQVTEEVKRDLRMLRLRGALDPKAHYKKLDATKFPKYFQMGTVVEGAADYYSGRLTNKQRKRTLTDEIMADEHLTQVRKKRFTKLQEERSQWAGKRGRKTPNERRPKAHHRPKH